VFLLMDAGYGNDTSLLRGAGTQIAAIRQRYVAGDRGQTLGLAHRGRKPPLKPQARLGARKTTAAAQGDQQASASGKALALRLPEEAWQTSRGAREPRMGSTSVCRRRVGRPIRITAERVTRRRVAADRVRRGRNRTDQNRLVYNCVEDVAFERAD